MNSDVIRYCPLCTTMNSWEDKIENSVYIKCQRCGHVYNYAELDVINYEPPYNYFELADMYVQNKVKYIEEAKLILSEVIQCHVHPGFPILLVGNGPGYLYDVLFDEYKSHSIIAIEPSKRRIDISRQLSKHNQKILNIPIEYLPLFSVCSCVIINNVLSWCEDPIFAFLKAWSATASPGRIIAYVDKRDPVDAYYRSILDIDAFDMMTSFINPLSSTFIEAERHMLFRVTK